MSILHQSKQTGRLFVKSFLSAIGKYITQKLNTTGEQRLLRTGAEVGKKLARWILAELEEHGEIYPPRGLFAGQLTFNLDVKMTQRKTTGRKPRPRSGSNSNTSAQLEFLL